MRRTSTRGAARGRRPAARGDAPLVRRGRRRAAAGPLDPLDVAILSALRDDGRASLRRVARVVGASVTTVSSRVRALEGLGVLQGFAPLISVQRLAAIGRSPECSVLYIAPRDGVEVARIARSVAEEPLVCYLFQLHGSAELMALASASSAAELGRLVQSLRRVPGVASVRPIPILEVHKERPGHPVGAPGGERAARSAPPLVA